MRFLLLVLAGCHGPAFDILDECPTCGPGEIRRGWRFSNPFELPPTTLASNGVAFVVNGDLHVFDDAGVERSITQVGDAERTAVAPDGSIYQVGEVEDGIAYQRLRAMSPDGIVRWEVNFASYILSTVQLVADDAAVYMVSGGADTSLYALSSSTGESTLPSSWTSRVLPDGQGGLFVFTDLDPGLFGSRVAKIVHLGPTGQQIWSRELELPDNPTHPTIHFYDAARTQTGIVLVGAFRGPRMTIDGMTATLPESVFGAGFVLALDSSGTPQWLHALDEVGLGDGRVCVTADSIVVGGSTNFFEGSDVLLAVVDATGVVRTDRFGGPGVQRLSAIAAGRDGAVWAHLDAWGEEDWESGDFSSELVIGSRTFASDGYNRRYIVEIQP